MKDTVIKGTGNSRYLKSAIPADITHAQLVELLRNGTFPFDFNGVNQGGITQLGDPLNQETLLKADTAKLYGKGGAAVPDDVLAVLSKAVLYGGDAYTDVNGVAVPHVKVETGSYVGTGTYGAGSPCSLTFDFVPSLWGLIGRHQYLAAVSNTYSSAPNILIWGVTIQENMYNSGYQISAGGNSSYGWKHLSYTDKTVSWYGQDATGQANINGATYYYFAVS